ncbi:MAG: transcriptional repressor [Candidatus Cloacimonetes bacterium]|jgi:Fur family ferric uptake transcriptional regulator|nr:transcriptional repressor [Candidatus Cloacimonadota bacterium]
MILTEGKRALNEYIDRKGMRNSSSRSAILAEFLKAEKHLTSDELYKIISNKIPTIGIATVYRSLHLFCECGIARELKMEDGISRYEPILGHEHHDHLVCTKCGKFIEIIDSELEEIQRKIANRYRFNIQNHKMELYGLCSDCK